ncbi:hypothetical protein EDM57_05195 [Brevibacillus gelatini]|uniref:Uncharacterized protein n=1 Tax=Brevibacillus gelatini TaxID=1655277 RepID=A0A3M8B842_9BACL|nr:hypothetical protein [Brevibacillus gelatini]RNB59539.1 hypothetical protein EDM57_05195 [Brevibacillus gelatini]
MDRLRQFIGLPHVLPSGIKIYSPTIDAIAEIGEGVYNLYLSLATFNKYDIVTSLFKLSPEELSEINKFDDYEFLISTPLLPEIENALSFFTQSKVVFRDFAFYIRDNIFVSVATYNEISNKIRELNGLSEKTKLKFRNARAERDYYRLQELRKKYNTDDTLSLKDMCSILCNAEGNGINIFNIGKLTIYQVYEHFERLSVKESHRRMLKVWANGHLKEDFKLQDWLVKTKL